ncbi:CAP domain-containing protein [Aeromicrobium duanguangcaii]|uniref:CAP domain-containing protein n=1 Tax=Aeromicrobium duanguangcaii TaxID=2968086 RepID=A0ABY5KB74_9ACTN|nr:CAP domain-containing protein [Aeromicrobium duanguangcaii]MCD9154879.1 CAP domain-containing protein [Aeromicrobium duanguangcaii]MCL3839081.1 CAP domain-containing protein [Aeromicrobium duanguangcaii]UUI67711.1 CAP domain-containing protein [Aeromicrobium duanguangcaii]
MTTALAAVPSAPASATTMSPSTFDQRLHDLTNSARHARGLGTLRFDSCLDRYAQRQARRMAAQQRMFHQNLSAVLRRCNARAVGENVAHGFRTPRSNIRGWLNSPGHRHNMLSRKYTRLGIGMVRDGRGHTWTVQLFGRPA